MQIIKAYQEFLVSFIKDFDYSHSPFLKFIPKRRLSSGEESMYNLLSLLNDLNFNIKNKTDAYDIRQEINIEQPLSLLFLFDEADLDFHPQWKKKFIHTITTAIPKIFENSKINIVFSTHDPLTLSDVPSNNIFFLEKENNVSIITKGNLKSFAANINDLLSEAFFINNGLIGDFAKRKIDEIITWINQNKDIDNRANTFIPDLEYYSNLISLIDEPITQLKLAEMLGELNNTNDLRQRLIDNEIDKLERLKNQ